MSFFTDRLNNIVRAQLKKPGRRAEIVTTIMQGFALLRKKPVPDLEDRVHSMEQRLFVMTEHICVGHAGSSLVVKVAGPSEALMTELRRGSDWYDPWDKVDETVLAAVLAGSDK